MPDPPSRPETCNISINCDDGSSADSEREIRDIPAE
jgi:hypothetical protein